MSRTQITEEVLRLLNVRNLLDNGGFEIWQRGDGPFTGNNDYTADRWQFKCHTDGTEGQVDRESTEIKFGNYSAKVAVTTASSSPDGVCFLQQYIEQYKSLVGKKISVSVWVKTDIENKISVAIEELNDTISESSFHTGDNTWQKLTATKEISGNGTYLKIRVGFLDNATETGTFYIDSAMLVIGAEPADFVPTPPAEEWDRCRRWYEVVWARTSGASERTTSNWRIDFSVRYSTIKKSTPTITNTGMVGYGTGINSSPSHVESDSTPSGFEVEV
ncbi:MAG: hypothetical protein ACTSPI_11790, partial [Candidatus Heimdallarchaeaceae archaeon]